MSKDLLQKISALAASGELDSAASANLVRFFEAEPEPFAAEVLEELLSRELFGEINDRFFQQLSFGTGGLRGRTIGRQVTAAEMGSAPEGNPPEHPCVGFNAMNFFNVSRATQGLAAFLQKQAGAQAARKPSVCIAHDTRFFSREFAEYASKIFTQLGCDVHLFFEHRSTPELSYAIRKLDADAGVVITASHNPPSYNGYKVYSGDGGQIVEPAAGEIIGCVNRIQTSAWTPLPPEQQGRLLSIREEMDSQYLSSLRSVVLHPGVFASDVPLRVVFSALHGTGGVIVPPLLRSVGVELATVPEQESPDGGFPTVASPNPEEPAAMKLGLMQAAAEGADLVFATDPDADRVGAAARRLDGELQLLTGNQIGSLLAWYRTQSLFDLGILNPENSRRAVLIKTVVTTDLQKAIAGSFGVRCVETLTGFKYIGAKLQKYETVLPPEVRSGMRDLGLSEIAATYLRDSSLFVFGGEESYGYSGAEFVRDKDANMSALMIAEVAAWAKARGKTLFDLLDDLYLRFGFFLERGESLTFEGAEGAQSIQSLVSSYTSQPPEDFNGCRVEKVTDYRSGNIRDSEGDILPREAMLIFDLQGGGRVALRPSGTEPKIKFYLFLHRPSSGFADLAGLENVKKDAAEEMKTLWSWIQQDALSRVAR